MTETCVDMIVHSCREHPAGSRDAGGADARCAAVSGVDNGNEDAEGLGARQQRVESEGAGDAAGPPAHDPLSQWLATQGCEPLCQQVTTCLLFLSASCIDGQIQVPAAATALHLSSVVAQCGNAKFSCMGVLADITRISFGIWSEVLDRSSMLQEGIGNWSEVLGRSSMLQEGITMPHDMAAAAAKKAPGSLLRINMPAPDLVWDEDCNKLAQACRCICNLVGCIPARLAGALRWRCNQPALTQV